MSVSDNEMDEDIPKAPPKAPEKAPAKTPKEIICERLGCSVEDCASIIRLLQEDNIPENDDRSLKLIDEWENQKNLAQLAYESLVVAEEAKQLSEQVTIKIENDDRPVVKKEIIHRNVEGKIRLEHSKAIKMKKNSEAIKLEQEKKEKSKADRATAKKAAEDKKKRDELEAAKQKLVASGLDMEKEDAEKLAKEIAAQAEKDAAAKKKADDLAKNNLAEAKARKKAEAAETRKANLAKKKAAAALAKNNDDDDDIVEIQPIDTLLRNDRMNVMLRNRCLLSSSVLKKGDSKDDTSEIFKSYMKKLVEEFRNAFSLLKDDSAMTVDTCQPSIGHMMVTGDTVINSQENQTLVDQANATIGLSKVADVASHSDYMKSSKKTFNLLQQSAKKKDILSMFLNGLGHYNKIQAYLEMCRTPKGKEIVKDLLFPTTERPKIMYKTIWTRMRAQLNDELNAKSLDYFRFFNDIAGERATDLLRNFQFTKVDLDSLLKHVPYKGNTQEKISLKEIAAFISNELKETVVPVTTDVATASSAADEQALVPAIPQTYMPDFLKTIPIERNQETSSLYFHFKYAPNLLASHYVIQCWPDFLNQTKKDLKSHGAFLQSPLEVFLVACIQNIFIDTAIPLITNEDCFHAEMVNTNDSYVSRLETILRLKGNEDTFAFFCHLFYKYHFILAYVDISLKEEEEDEEEGDEEEATQKHRLSIYVMDSLKIVAMDNILVKLKTDINTAWTRCHSDRLPLLFDDFTHLSCTQQVDGSNDCLVASCTFLWHFYSNGLHLENKIASTKSFAIPRSGTFSSVRSALFEFFSEPFFDTSEEIVMDWEMLERIKFIFEQPNTSTSALHGIPFFGKIKIAETHTALVLWNDPDFKENCTISLNSGIFVKYSNLNRYNLDSFCLIGEENFRKGILLAFQSRYKDAAEGVFGSITDSLEFLENGEHLNENEDLVVWSMFLYRKAELEEEEKIMTIEALESVLQLCIPFDNVEILRGFLKFCIKANLPRSGDVTLPEFFSPSRKDELVVLMRMCVEEKAFISLSFILENSPPLTSQEAEQLLDATYSADWIKVIGIVIMKGRVPLLDHDELKKFNPYFLNLALIEAIKDGRSALIKNGCLSLAANYLSLDMIKYLIDHGANVNSSKGNLLMAAIANAKLEIINFLFPTDGGEALANVLVIDAVTYATALSIACALTKSDINAMIFKKISSLHVAASPVINLKDFVEPVQKLIDLGADPSILPPNSTDWDSYISKYGDKPKKSIVLGILGVSPTVTVTAGSVIAALASPTPVIASSSKPAPSTVQNPAKRGATPTPLGDEASTKVARKDAHPDLTKANLQYTLGQGHGLGVYLLPTYGYHWNPTIYLAVALVNSIPPVKFNKSLHPFGYLLKDPVGIHLQFLKNIEEVMKLNEFPVDHSRPRIKGNLYLAEINTLLNGNDHLKNPDEAKICSFLDYIEEFFGNLSTDCSDLGYRMSFYIDTLTNVTTYIKNAPSPPAYLVIHNKGTNLSRNAYVFKNPRIFKKTYSYHILASISSDNPGSYFYHSVSYEDSTKIYHPCAKEEGKGSTYPIGEFDWNKDADNFKLRAVLLKRD